MEPQALDFTLLTHCQQDAATGCYAQALAGFIQWFAARYRPAIQRRLHNVERLRRLALRSSYHRRTPEIVGTLFLGMHYFTQYAVDHQALSPHEAKVLRHRALQSLAMAAGHHAQLLATSEPAQRFLELLSTALVSGRAYIAAPNGTVPAAPQAWGWRRRPTSTNLTDWRPAGEKIGWIQGDEIFLLPDAAYAVAQTVGKAMGEGFGVRPQTLWKRLKEWGALRSTDPKRETLKIRRTCEGRQHNVLHIAAASLLDATEGEDGVRPNE
jgi:hypothetical protein